MYVSATSSYKLSKFVIQLDHAQPNHSMCSILGLDMASLQWFTSRATLHDAHATLRAEGIHHYTRVTCLPVQISQMA